MQSERRRIRWPQASRTAEWQKDSDKILEVTYKGDVERRLQTMTTIVVSMAAERFGLTPALHQEPEGSENP